MDNGMDALIVDDLSKHAVAYRQVSLVLKRPSGREAYPGDVFYLHSRLLERAARVGEQYGNGSLTASRSSRHRRATSRRTSRPTSSPLPTVRSISRRTCSIKASGPPSRSACRCRESDRLRRASREAGGRELKGDLAQFRELAAFAQFGSDLDATTQAKIDRGKRIIELFNQPQYNPIPVETQVAMLWMVQNGHMDDVPVERIKDFQTRLTEFLTTSKASLLEQIDARRR